MLQRLLVVLAGCIHPESRCAAVLAVHLHAAAHVLTQLFLKMQKKAKPLRLPHCRSHWLSFEPSGAVGEV